MGRTEDDEAMTPEKYAEAARKVLERLSACCPDVRTLGPQRQMAMGIGNILMALYEETKTLREAQEKTNELLLGLPELLEDLPVLLGDVPDLLEDLPGLIEDIVEQLEEINGKMPPREPDIQPR